jgi:hypothetical protein
MGFRDSRLGMSSFPDNNRLQNFCSMHWTTTDDEGRWDAAAFEGAGLVHCS